MGAQSVTNWTVISQVSAKFHYANQTQSGDLSETGADITNFVWDASWRHFALVRLVEFGHGSKNFLLKTMVKMNTWNYVLILKQQILMVKTCWLTIKCEGGQLSHSSKTTNITSEQNSGIWSNACAPNLYDAPPPHKSPPTWLST